MKYASRGDFGDSAQILRRPGLQYSCRPKTEIRFSKKASSRKVCNTSKECAALTKSKEETRLMPGFFYFSVFYRQNPPSAYNVRLSVGYLTILRKLCSVRRSLEGRGGRGKKQTRNFGRTRPRPSDTPYRRADMSCRRQQPPTTEDVQTQGNTPRRGDRWSAAAPAESNTVGGHSICPRPAETAKLFCNVRTNKRLPPVKGAGARAPEGL